MFWQCTVLLAVSGLPFEVPLEPIYHADELTKLFHLGDDGFVGSRQVQYEAEVYIGNPTQHVSLILDSTYPYIGVDHWHCQNCSAGRRFAPEHSFTYQELESGLGTDVVGFTANDDHRLFNQTLAVHSLHSAKHYQEADGLLVTPKQGLGFEHPHKGNPHFLTRLKQQGVIEQAVFAVALNDMEVDRAAPPSSVAFGMWNLTKFSSAQELVWTEALIDRDFWEITIQSAYFGDKLIQSESHRAILDTSQPYIFLPTAVYDKFYAALCTRLICNRPNKDWPCERGYPIHLPELTLSAPGVRFVLTPRDYFDRYNGQCYLTIQPGEQWNLGISFLQKYYTVFHLDNQQVGFAERLNTTKSYYLDLMLLLVGLLALAAAVVIVKQQCCPRESHQAHGHENEIQSPLMAEQPQESSGTK